ncbi:MAG: hypothetical protein NTV80_06770 [Verrucomicrobia bacterium]|nr:hypothetical protein [Verrucomicrobiota bacterium]
MLWVPLLLVVLALILQWLKLTSPQMGLLPNFSPWMALAFTGTLVMSRALPWAVWPVAMFGVNLAALGFSAALTGENLAIYAIYALAAWSASQFRGRLGLFQGLLGVVLCSAVFYLVTNTVSWAGSPAYAKSFSGWLQALTTGLPGYLPTWTFFRASFFSDLGFSALLMLAFNAEARVRDQATMPLLAVTAR